MNIYSCYTIQRFNVYTVRNTEDINKMTQSTRLCRNKCSIREHLILCVGCDIFEENIITA